MSDTRFLSGKVEAHYDRVSWLYSRLWGEHIHHGYWEGSAAREAPEAAQVRLIEKLAGAARVEGPCDVLDAGCGLGGSSLWLARERGCRVTGVTLSGRQARMAARSACRAGLSGRVKFLHDDLEAIEFPAASFDVVWSIECTEHLADKAAFLARAARWLRPGGRVAICAWTRAEGALDAAGQAQIEEICGAFFCPSLAAASSYARWMEQAGLRVEEASDLTERTSHTWEICIERTRSPWFRLLASLLGAGTRRFLAGFEVMLAAYRAGSLRYSLVVAGRPQAAQELTGTES